MGFVDLALLRVAVVVVHAPAAGLVGSLDLLDRRVSHC